MGGLLQPSSGDMGLHLLLLTFPSQTQPNCLTTRSPSPYLDPWQLGFGHHVC